MTNLMRVDNLTKWYVEKKKKQTIKAVDGVSFTLEKGKILGIIGESGCGKSTLGRLLVALENPTDGSIEFEGEIINHIVKKEPLRFRRNCQMIFQNPFDTFDPRNDIQKILTNALKIHNIGNSKEERVDICIKAMEDAGIKPAKDYLNRYPHELSGGQLQRISIIRSMLLKPKLIIADEPVSMLDVSVRADILNLLLNMTKEKDTSMIFISHDIATTRYISDMIAVMYLGRIVEMGMTDDIIQNPKHPYTKVLISIKWHDGEKFSSEDVKWTFDTILEEKGFASSSLSDIEEIVCPDENTVQFKLKAPNAGLLGYLAWFGTYIMPKHIYEGTDWLENPANQNPIGTGPFKFVEHKKGESVTIERNDDYWGDKAYLDKVIFSIIPDEDTAFQAFLNGEIDETGSIPNSEADRFDNDPDYVVKEKIWPNKGYLLFNYNKGKFADKKVRQAVAYGIDRDEIFTKALKGVGQKAEYFISPVYDWALNENAKLPERDIEKAKSLLEEAGYKADENGIYFSTTIDTFPGFEDVVEVVQANFKEFGIDLKVNAMDDAAYDEKVWFGHDFEMTILGGYQGPDISAIGSRIGTDGSMNLGEYSNPRVDELLAEGLVLTTEEERAPKYKEIQEILAEDLPMVFFNEKGAKIIVKSYVKGHPGTEACEKASESEFTYVWLDK